MDKVWQEIHCTTSGGGCGGYILLGLNARLNHVAKIVCPKCSHAHQRRVKDGHVQEKDRFTGDPAEEIYPTMAAWRQEPRSVTRPTNERDGALIKDWQSFQDQQMQDLWREHFGERL